jgi:hypothetical protein
MNSSLVYLILIIVFSYREDEQFGAITNGEQQIHKSSKGKTVTTMVPFTTIKIPEQLDV